MTKTLEKRIRSRCGLVAVGCALLMAFLAATIKLFPPSGPWVWVLFAVFALLFTLGILASFCQQRLTSAQAEQQNDTLKKIAEAVGVTQAETADVRAETKRQMMEIQVKLADEAKPVVVIRCSIDGERQPAALPAVENIGKSAATNIKIEDIRVHGAHGLGTFKEVDALRPGESREVEFDAPDEGLVFRGYFITYLENDLRHRPPIDWHAIITQEDAKDLFEPLKMPINVAYTDPASGKRYRSEHELEFTFSRHATVIFRKQVEIT